MRPFLIAALIISAPLRSDAQSWGIQLGGDYFHPMFEGNQGFNANAVYLAVHRDFDLRIGAQLDVRWCGLSEDINGLEFLYKAKYFCSNNDESAFFVGSFIGAQRLKGDYRYRSGVTVSGYPRYETAEFKRIQVPIGITCGVRGGLAGYFAELNFNVGYNLGGGSALGTEAEAPSTRGLYTALGFSWLGFGWDQR